MFFHMVSKAQSDLAPSPHPWLYPTCLLGSLFELGLQKDPLVFFVLAMLSVGILTVSHSSYAKNVSDLFQSFSGLPVRHFLKSK